MSRLLSIYRHLLRLYPKPYREKYAGQMTQTLIDMLDDQSSRLAKSIVWLRAAADLPLAIAQEHVTQLGGAMAQNTPTYVKQSTVLSAVLLLPFFVIVPVNALHPLPLSWKDGLYAGVFILPIVALVVSVATFVRWAADKRTHQGTSVWGSLKHLSISWPLLVMPLLAFMVVGFVFGHDSVHCVTNNPVKAVRHARQTLECVSRG